MNKETFVQIYKIRTHIHSYARIHFYICIEKRTTLKDLYYDKWEMIHWILEFNCLLPQPIQQISFIALHKHQHVAIYRLHSYTREGKMIHSTEIIYMWICYPAVCKPNFKIGEREDSCVVNNIANYGFTNCVNKRN